MTDLYEAYQKLRMNGMDGAAIGLAAGVECTFFCTPIGATIIGWDNEIAYCFLAGHGDMVFCVNPESCCDIYVYPIARHFRDFLGLILAVGHTNPLQQIIGWEQNAFARFCARPEEQQYRQTPAVQTALAAIRSLGVLPLADAFAYVKALQRDFPYAQIRFSHAYYDALGIPCPEKGEKAKP